MTVSPQRRLEIIDALRHGTVPSQGLDALAVGLDRFQTALDEDLDPIATGGGVFKAIRGEYGAGKTFLTRWLAERAKSSGLAAAEVQISEADTPPHRYQTIYRRLVEQLSTSSVRSGAFRSVVDSWFFTLEEDVLSSGGVDESDTSELTRRTAELMARRLGGITRTAPAFAAVLRAYLVATSTGDRALADGLLAWLGGQPHVAPAVKRAAGVKGDTGTPSFFDGPQGVQRLPPWPSGWPPTLPPPPDSTTPGRSRSVCPGSPSTPSSRSAGGSGISTQPVLRRRTGWA